MEETRSQIHSTVEELKSKVNETLDWRHYIDRYPGTSLTVAVALGMLLGRSLGALVRRNGDEEAEPYGYGGYRTAEGYGESGLTAAGSRAAGMVEEPYASAEPALSGARRAVGQSVSRLGSRAEGILNRLIDELTDAVETTLVPALTTRFRGLIDFDRRGSRRHEGGVGGEVAGASRARWDEPVREERGGVYPGGPTGTQHYPSQGRTAEQG